MVSEEPEGTTAKPTGKRSTRTTRPAGTAVESTAVEAAPTGSKKASKTDTARPNIFKRIRKYLREVLAELRKVIWPSKKQMVTYTAVVLVFVVFMVAYIGGLDVLFIKGVTWLFG
ncbi:MAG: preprotein translocase subunit SecE [Nocardiaceae bacterium]|nr:preprotein translocase subunit SecE [Nocardiaceae bacterium]